MPKIYISSTYEDLKDCREAVYDALRKVKADAIAMEDYVAKDQRPLQNCLEDVASCDIYLGIFAWRYGYIPAESNENPNNLSITELEYRKAKEKGIPSLIFLLDETVPWPLKFSDGIPQSGTKGDSINKLRNELKKNHSVSFFKNKDELASNVLAAVNSKDITSPREKNTSISTEQAELFKMNKSTQNPLHFFGEKRIFVGREDYIDKKIKDLLKEPGSRVSIVGPGGSGKSQLAFKALHQYYEKDKFIDLVIPVYFSATLSSAMVGGNDATPNSTNSISFRKFLNDIGFYLIGTNYLQIKEQELDQLSIQTCQNKIYEALTKIRYPILYCDNFETLSSYIEENKGDQNAKSIINFLNNQLPLNVSLLVTSRNRRNFLSEEHTIILEGLKFEDAVSLFIKNASVYQDHLRDIKNSKIQNLLKQIVTKTGGHPLSIEILAKTYEGAGETELEDIFYTLGKERADLSASEERLQSLQNCFDYSIDKLDPNIQKLLPLLTIFHSPFPADVVEKVFNKEEKAKFFLLELYNKSLLSRIERDKDGSFTSNKFWLYTIHPALSNYLKDKYKTYITTNERELIPYFCNYYLDILNETYYTWGKDCHLDFMRRFEIISKVDDNDFDRSITFAINSKEGEQKLKQIGPNVAIYLGHIYTNLGFYDDALTYYSKVLSIHEKTNDKLGMASDLTYIGNIFRKKGLYDEALVYLKKALAIYESLKDKVNLAKIFYSLSLIYGRKNLEIEKKEAMDNVKRILSNFRKDTGYSHPLEKNIESIAEINI